MSRTFRMICAASLAVAFAVPSSAVALADTEQPVGDTRVAAPTGVPPWVCRVFPALCRF